MILCVAIIIVLSCLETNWAIGVQAFFLVHRTCICESYDFTRFPYHISWFYVLFVY